MSYFASEAAGKPNMLLTPGPTETAMNNGYPSKEQFFERLGAVADEMIEAYGKDFTLGALILTARFVAEGKGPGDAAKSMIPTSEDQGSVAR
jgi:hypothetical protein